MLERIKMGEMLAKGASACEAFSILTNRIWQEIG